MGIVRKALLGISLLSLVVGGVGVSYGSYHNIQGDSEMSRLREESKNQGVDSIGRYFSSPELISGLRSFIGYESGDPGKNAVLIHTIEIVRIESDKLENDPLVVKYNSAKARESLGGDWELISTVPLVAGLLGLACLTAGRKRKRSKYEPSLEIIDDIGSDYRIVEK